MEAEVQPTGDSEHDPFADLTDEELYWKARQKFLETHGYMLRPRYRQEWIPSWRGKPHEAVFTAEDAYSLPFRTSVMDATRISDGALVYMKRTRADSQELRILSRLNTNELRRDPRNHCVPLLDVLQDPYDPSMSIMVMPFLKYINSPVMERVEDVLECIDQVLEGLVFIHDQGVAHRDCAYKNVMMDASAMFPKGFHPIIQSSLPDVSGRAPVISRAAAHVKYFFIDFGISTVFTSQSDAPRLVVGSSGLDREPPELSDSVPYDPFKLDVFLIGNLIRRELHDKFFGLGMLTPLINRMVHQDPARRPSAAEAHRQFKAIRKRVPTLYRHWRLQPRDSFLLVRAFWHLYSLFYGIYRSVF